MKKIKLSDSVTEIDEDAFCQCSDLENIIIPASVQYIGKYAFSNCYNLDTAEILGRLDTIGSKIFYKCSNLKFITYPRGLRDANKLREGSSATLIPY